MLAIRRSAQSGHFAAFNHTFVAGPHVPCPRCSEIFDLYATPKLMEAAQKVLVDYLRQNCPRHVAYFAADESKIREHCVECANAYGVLGLWQQEDSHHLKTA